MVDKSFQTNETVEEQGSDFNYRELIDALILHWYWFLVSVVACVLVAFGYLKYKSPVYTSWMKVLIKEEDPYKQRVKGNALADFSQLGLVNNSNGFDNEVEILGSKMLAKRAVTNLKLYTQYAFKGRLRNTELYGNSPLLADMSPEDLDTLSSVVMLKVSPTENNYHIEGETKYGLFETNVKSFPAKVKTPCGWVKMVPNPGTVMDFERTLIIYIMQPDAVANSYAGRLSIEPTSKMTTIVRLSMNDTQRGRSVDYLNELIRVYNEGANEIKNEVALKTEAFINNRLKIIDAELGGTESELETYKKRNRLVNLTTEAATAFTGAETYQDKQVELQTQMVLVKSLKDYVDNPKNYMELIPANLGLKDVALNKAIADYNTMVMERNRLLKTAPEASPVVVTTNNAIAALYPGIRHSLSMVYSNLQVQKRSVDEQYNQLMSRLSEAPTQERVLADIGRQQTVKATLYQILLQKREENAISLASTVDQAQIVDLPESSPFPVSPKSKMILLMALAAGLCIPAGVIYLMNLLRIRIEGRNDIEKLTKIPVLSDIFMSKGLKDGKRTIVVREDVNGTMEEAFRNLRTNLGFIMKKDEKVLICTSILPSEGKTFVSTNLAMSMALMGRKVLVVGVDVRKPRLAKLFGIKSGGHGLTTYLASDDNTDAFLREQIFSSGVHAGLDVLPAGLIPPNPAELIASERLEQAFARFREWYDYIILDTPPLGLVSDTLLLGRLADATLVVCRCDYSLKRNFAMINSLHDENKLPHINLVLNGVDLERRKYGYYYGSGKYGSYSYYGSYGRYGVYGTMAEDDENGSSSSRRHRTYMEDNMEDKD